MNTSVKQYIKPIAYVLAFLVFVIIGFGSGIFNIPTDPAIVAEITESTTESEVTAPTTVPAAVPTTEEPTESTTTATTQAASEAAAEAATETSIETPTEDEPEGNLVWISKTGKKYHSNPDCSNMKNPSQITEEKAVDMHLEPCSKCH